MDELYQSRRGDVHTKQRWMEELDAFWKCFDAKIDYCAVAKLPKRPVDDWERYVKIMGLEKIS